MVYAPTERVVKAEPKRQADQVACGWCGMFSPAGPACELCGSPLNLHRTCPYCQQVATSAYCWTCQVSIEKRILLKTT
jgi:hypothetical protein